LIKCTTHSGLLRHIRFSTHASAHGAYAARRCDLIHHNKNESTAP